MTFHDAKCQPMRIEKKHIGRRFPTWSGIPDEVSNQGDLSLEVSWAVGLTSLTPEPAVDVPSWLSPNGRTNGLYFPKETYGLVAW